MEQHIARLVSSCGLSRFDYRAWPGIEIVVAPPPPEVEDALPDVAAEPALVVPAHAVMEAPAVAAPPEASQPQPELSEAKPPRISSPSPMPPKPADTEPASGVRTRSLLASLAKLIETPPPRIVIAEPAVAPMAQQGLGRRAEEQPPGPPRGYEAPVHVGYLPAPPRPPARRRFALLDEIAVARRRVDPRRGASHLPPD
jgi:hypothetical protein